MASYSYLPHRLAEAVVVIGADQYSGLNLLYRKNAEPIRQLSFDRSAFNAHYQPQIIATLTESQAFFPDKMISSPSAYPPPPFSRHNARHGPATLQRVPSSPFGDTHLAHRVSRRSSSVLSFHDEDQIHRLACRRRRYSANKETARKPTAPDGVIKSETIQGIPRFLYPNGLKIEAVEGTLKRPETTIYYMSLTELNGGRLYATSINCYRLFRAVRVEEDGQVRLRGVEEEELAEMKERSFTSNDRVEEEDDDEKEGPLVFVPFSVLLISKSPYMMVMKQCLSAFINHLNENENNYEHEIMSFAASMTNTPIPPSGTVAIEVVVHGSLVTIPPPLPMINTVVDFDIFVLLKAFKPQDIVRMLVALLTQQRLVVLTNSVTRSVIACETILLFLRPFKWLFPFVPNLPEFLLEFLEAPGPFFYGCDVRFLDEVRAASNVVIANMETGEVEVPSTVTLPMPPQEPCENLYTLLSHMRPDFDATQLSRPSFLTIDDLRRARSRFDAFNRQVVLLGFMELMVDLFRSVKQCLQFNSIDKSSTINVKLFINTQTEAREFYEAVCNCELFTDFIRRRAASSDADPWDIVEEKTRKNARKISAVNNPGRRRSSFLLNAIEQIQVQDIHDAADKDIKEQDLKSLRLVDFDLGGQNANFIESNIVLLRNQIEQTKDDTVTATLLRIKSELHLAIGQKADCLKVMFELSHRDISLLCKTHTRRLLASLSPTEIIAINETDPGIISHMHKLVEDHSVMASASLERRPSSKSSSLSDTYELVDTENRLITNFRLPDKPLNSDDFRTLLKNAVVTNDLKLQKSLFSLLSEKSSNGRFPHVDADVFKQFYTCWFEALNEILDIAPICTAVQDNEIVKVSGRILIEKLGTGRILLTLDSLRWMKDTLPVQLNGGIQLKSISQIIPAGSTRFGTRKRRSIVIKHSIKQDDVPSPLVLNMQTENDMKLWSALLKEMWTGQIVSEAQKDPTLLYRAMDNAMLIDVLWRTVNDPIYGKEMPYDQDSVIQKIADLSNYHAQNNYQLDDVTQLYLNKKFNVWTYKGDQRSVAILKSYVTQDGKVKLCCVCNEDGQHSKTSRLVIIDGTSQVLESEVLAVKGELMCVLQVGNFLWVGDMKYKIYIIHIGRQQVIRELVEHQHDDGVISLATTVSKELVASGSVGGEVLVWQVSSGQVLQRWRCLEQSGIIDLCFSPSAPSQLWCCVRSAIHVYEVTTGEELFNFQLHSAKTSIPTAPLFQCLAVCPERNQVFAALGRSSSVAVFDGSDVRLIRLMDLYQECYPVNLYRDTDEGSSQYLERRACSGISRLAIIGDYMWAACKDGNISISKHTSDLDGTNFKQLIGHSDRILSMCAANVDGVPMVFTGARHEDGKIAQWFAQDCS